MNQIETIANKLLDAIGSRENILAVHEFDTTQTADLLVILLKNGLNTLESKKYGKIAVLQHELAAMPTTKEPINFHTDGIYYTTPPTYILMHCVNPGIVQNPTLFIPASQISKGLSTTTIQILSLIEISYPYSGMVNYHPVLDLWEEEVTITLISKGNIRLNLLRCKEKGYEPTIRDINQALIELYHVLDSAVYQMHTWNQGDLLLFNNRTMLHALGPNINGNYTNPERVIHRIWLQKLKT